jgi:hypothetical protein
MVVSPKSLLYPLSDALTQIQRRHFDPHERR